MKLTEETYNREPLRITPFKLKENLLVKSLLKTFWFSSRETQ